MFSGEPLERQRMTVEQLRKAQQARPFQPFTVCLADGPQIRVPHPETLFVPPTAQRTFVVAESRDVYSVMDLLLVTSLDFGNSKAGRRRARSA